MTGLREYARDLGLAARLGDAALDVPDAARVVRLGAEHLALDLVAARCVHARWKPGVSVTTTHAVETAGGDERVLVVRQYVDGKDSIAEKRALGAEHGRVLADDGRLLLHLHDRDRVLEGFALLADPRRLARLFEEAELVPARSVRRRRTRARLLRYKPERRAVYRLDLGLRDARPDARRFALRVLSRDEASVVATRRRALASAVGSLAPTFLAHAERFGVLVEAWLDGLDEHAHDAFAHAHPAGRALAALHAAPCAEPYAPTARGLDPDSPLRRLPTLAARAAALFDQSLPDAPTAWVHGDLHPDQWAVDGNGALVLLDWDAVRPGHALEDVVSWVADHLEHVPGVALADAAEPLLVGLAECGAPVDAAGFELRVARALVERAENALRRLQLGADDHAARLVDAAASLAGHGGARRNSTGGPATLLERALVALDLPPSTVERVDEHAGALATTTLAAGRVVFHRVADGAAEELDPFADDALPFAARLADEREHFDVVAYRPGKRLTLRDRDDGAYWKLLRRGRARRAVDRLDVARRTAHPFVRVPATRSWSAETDHFVLEPVPGEPLELRAEVTAPWALGTFLRQWHAEPPPAELPLHDVEAELDVLARARDTCERLHRVPAGWDELATRAAAFGRSLPTTPPVLAHRDLHDGQLLWGDAGLALVDFDLLARADAALDLGNLLAHLSLRAMQGVRGATPEHSTAARRALLDGYDLPEASTLRPAVRFYECVTHLRLALVYSTRPRWQGVVAPLVEAARRDLHALSQP